MQHPSNRLTGRALLSLVLLSSPWSGVAAAESTTERNQRLVERAFANWSAGRGSLFDDLLSPTVVWTIQGSGPAAPGHTHRAPGTGHLGARGPGRGALEWHGHRARWRALSQ